MSITKFTKKILLTIIFTVTYVTLLPGPFLLSYSVLFLVFSLFFRFCALRYIKVAIASAFERT